MYTKDDVRQAKKRVKKKKEFYQHLVSYVSINVFLILLNLLTSPTKLWFFFPMMGWGIGLLFHYVDVFGIPGFGMLDKEWEKREFELELRKMKENDPGRLSRDTDGESLKQEELELKELRKNYDESELV